MAFWIDNTTITFFAPLLEESCNIARKRWRISTVCACCIRASSTANFNMLFACSFKSISGTEALGAIVSSWSILSISLKEGEEVFIRHAKDVLRFGAAVVVMCFDEEGQATSYERRIEIAERACIDFMVYEKKWQLHALSHLYQLPD